MLYEIINPSDKYTIECPDLEIAFIACVILGEGQYAFDPIGDGERVPLFLFGPADQWCQEHFQKTVGEVFGHVMTTRKAELADALDSVVVSDRQEFLRLTAGLTRPAFEAERARWHNDQRTSMNDIGGRAYKLAAQFRQPIDDDKVQIEEPPRQVFGL